MLTVLGGLAEFERELIRARTGEGRKRAQARGVKFGRPPKLNAHQRREAIERPRNGETQAEIARTYGVDATTIGRLDCAPAGKKQREVLEPALLSAITAARTKADPAVAIPAKALSEAPVITGHTCLRSSRKRERCGRNG